LAALPLSSLYYEFSADILLNTRKKIKEKLLYSGKREKIYS
jgi:hypothetical protein